MITERAEYFYLSAFETEYKKKSSELYSLSSSNYRQFVQKGIADFSATLNTFFPVYTCFALPHKHRRRHVGQNKYSTGCFNAQRNQLIYQHQAGKKDKQQGCVANWAK